MITEINTKQNLYSDRPEVTLDDIISGKKFDLIQLITVKEILRWNMTTQYDLDTDIREMNNSIDDRLGKQYILISRPNMTDILILNPLLKNINKQLFADISNIWTS